MKFDEIYTNFGYDLRKVREYKGVCRELSLQTPPVLLTLVLDYLDYYKFNMLDFIKNGHYKYLICEELESSKQVDMAKKLFMTYYYFLKNMEKQAKRLELEMIKNLTWK